MAELLGDVDLLLRRVEALPEQLEEAETQITATIKALDAAGHRFRFAVNSFTEEAKADLNEHYARATKSAALATSNTLEEQRAALQEAARLAFEIEAAERAGALAQLLSGAARHFRQSWWLRLVEYGLTAVLASSLTVALIHATKFGS